MPLRVVLFTQGGLGLDVARKLTALDGVALAGIFLEEPPPRHWTLEQRIQRYLRYYGIRGSLEYLFCTVAARFRPLRHPVEGEGEQARRIAQEAGVAFFRSSDLHAPEILTAVRALEPDLGVVVGTTILKPSLYEIPKQGSINIHQAKVPEYQGSSPLFWALYNDEPEMGLTIHQVAERVDAGDVLLEDRVPLVYDFERYRGEYAPFCEDFHAGIRDRSVDLMIEAVRQIAAGEAARRPQDPAAAVRRRIPTYAQKQELKRLLAARYAARPRAAGRPDPKGGRAECHES